METIYFPFPFIEKENAQMLFNTFGKFVFYHPFSQQISKELHKLNEDGIINLKTPIDEEDNEFLFSLFEQYKKEASNAFFDSSFSYAAATLASKYDNDSIFRIKEEIKKGEENKEKENKNIYARLTLLLFNEFVLKKKDADFNFSSASLMEKNIFNEIQGKEKENSAKNTNQIDDSFLSKNIDQILKAWSHLFLKDFQQNIKDNNKELRILCTNNFTAFETLADIIPNSKKIDPTSLNLKIDKSIETKAYSCLSSDFFKKLLKQDIKSSSDFIIFYLNKI